MKLFLALVLLAPTVLAQTVVRLPSGPGLGAPLASPTPFSAKVAAPAPFLSSPLTLIPALAAPAPAPLAVAPAALTPVVSASAAADLPKPGTPRAAASLAQRAAEFERLVSDLTGGDREKSDAAAVALRALKDEHLNPSPKGKKTPVLDLKPMQIPAGMIEVQAKADDLRAMGKKEIDAWEKERSVPVLEDYKGRKRPVDHHHEARATWEAGKEDVYTHHYFDDEMHARIKALPRDKYYAVTRAMGLFYDRDQFGAGPHDPDHLPEDVRSMADDPFRSVAWQVRKRGGYDKTTVPFAEFAWAQFFRERVATYPTRADFEKTVLEALKIAHSDDARNLPGWRPR